MIRRLVVAAGSVVAASVMLAAPLGAQTGVLSGVIYDQTNKTGLAGAEVRIKGTELVATSGADGRFTIANVPAGSRELETTRTGYRSYRLPSVKIGAADTAFVYLALSKAPDDAGAVDSTSPGDEVRGRMLLSTRETSVGEVSENAPLYIIDGIVLASGSIPKGLEALDIVSVEVVKGATAESLYGSRGKNGIIRITTRRKPD